MSVQGREMHKSGRTLRTTPAALLIEADERPSPFNDMEVEEEEALTRATGAATKAVHDDVEESETRIAQRAEERTILPALTKSIFYLNKSRRSVLLEEMRSECRRSQLDGEGREMASL